MLLFNLKKRPVRITYFSGFVTGFSLLYFLKKRGDYKNLISINPNQIIQEDLISINPNLINQEEVIPNQIIQEEVNPNLIAEIKINQEESVKKEVTYNITEEEIKCKQKWICLFDLVIMDYSSKKQLELEL